MNSTVLLTSVDINIPGYRILRPIGEGGMASVFLAVQESLDREVALKVMSPALAANAEFASRFLTEGKITAKLQHPNLVTVYDIGRHGSVFYLAAEYIPGGTLKDRIQAGGLGVAHILDIAADVAQGLDFAHQKGFVHRDVKPGNILFRNDGRVVLADFGIAKAMDGSNSSTVAGASIGTPDYMSPEQARGEAVDGRSDLYSLGTVLYEMLVGHPPYQASDPFAVALMHVTHPLPELPEPYAWLQPLMRGLMAKIPAERYNTGAAFVQAVQSLVASAPAGAIGVETGRRAGGSGRLSDGAATQQRTRVSVGSAKGRPAWLLPVAGAVLATALAAVAWMALQPGEDAVPVAASPATLPVPTDGLRSPVPVESPAVQVEGLLAQAEHYLSTGTDISHKDVNRFVVYPEDESALGLYLQVLRVDPGNARATAGIRRIADFYSRYAYRFCERGSWNPCLTLAGNGLLAVPDDPFLLALKAAAEDGARGLEPTLPPAPDAAE